MNFPPDIVRMIAAHLDGCDLTNKAHVANLAATSRNYRRALAEHVKRHAILFPSLAITGDEHNLRIQFWQRRREQDWNTLVADRILRVFPLAPIEFGRHYHYRGVGYTVILCCCIYGHEQHIEIPGKNSVMFPLPQTLRDYNTLDAQDTLDIYNRALADTATLRSVIKQLRQEFQ
jgi:hypothetical protein